MHAGLGGKLYVEFVDVFGVLALGDMGGSGGGVGAIFTGFFVAVRGVFPDQAGGMSRLLGSDFWTEG